MNWTTVMNAIHAWFVTTSGLAANKVVWAGQPVPKKAYPCAVLTIGDIATIGQDTTSYSAPSAGLITPTTKGMRYFTLSCDVRTIAEPQTPLTPTSGPSYYLGKVRDAVWSPDTETTFRAAELAIVRPLTTTKLDQPIDDVRIELRQVFDIRLVSVSNTTYSTNSYIENVSAAGEIDDIEIDGDFGV